MYRRTLLTTGAMALVGATFADGAPRALGADPKTPVLALPRVNVSWDRVVRTTVGLRPHRDSGFVVRAEKRGEQLLVHDYGHGGAGMSLAWGTGALAADLALKQDGRRAAVIGAGSVGLTAARQLQRRGFEVTIYAKSVPPDTTSNASLASFTPLSGLVAKANRTHAWEAQFRQAAAIAFRQLEVMATPEYGISWVDNYLATDNSRPPAREEADLALLPKDVRPDANRIVLGPDMHPFPTRFAIHTRTLCIDPNVYLDALMRDFVDVGGRVVIREFESADALRALDEDVIVNCTGIGAYALFNDQELVPVKGQLTILEPQPEITYRAGIRTGTGARALNISMNPRSDGIVLGNAQERGVWSLEPNEEVRQAIVTGAMEFFGAMK